MKPYQDIYYSERCTDGLLICSKSQQADEICSCDNPNYVYNIHDFSSNKSRVTSLDKLVLTPPLPDTFYHLTKQCCEAARQCCSNVLLPASLNLNISKACPATWDGWQCFDSSDPSIVSTECPTYIYGDYSRNMYGQNAVKECTIDGWGKSPHGSSEWTDYTGCHSVQQDAQVKLMAGIVAFSISVLCIIPAICILSLLRPLRSQPMFVLHRHLLTSFLLSGLFYLFNCFFFIVNGAPGDNLYLLNDISCRLLFLVQLRFLRLSTFSWMLAEGVYLYRLLHSTSAEGESLRPYKILCWGVPAILSAVYGILRELFDNEGCWVSPSVYGLIEWTVMAPCLIALCVNMLLVTFIMYILVKKLRCDPHLERMQYRKAVRAALMLIPVFGLHFLFTIYRIPSVTHQVINLVLDGLQGCAVSVIICYTNKTVLECVVKRWTVFCENRSMTKECKARTSIQTDTRTPLVHNL
ncbi:unnamed protein product [Auanema sp. JU1783]|nr:unnamed protein product [Auanema sp. JU1783]